MILLATRIAWRSQRPETGTVFRQQQAALDAAERGDVLKRQSFGGAVHTL